MAKQSHGRVTQRALLALAIVVAAASSGCRGNLGSAFAIATGRADLDRLVEAGAERANATAPSRSVVNQASFTPAELSSTAGLFPAVDPETGNPAPPPTREEAFAAILPELQQLAAVNPAAQQKLLAEMQTAEPAHWPLLVRRVRADLAVHAKLTKPEEAPAIAKPIEHAEEIGNGSGTRSAFDPPPLKSASRKPVAEPQASTLQASQAKPMPPSLETPAHFAPKPATPTASLVRPNDTAFDPPPVHPMTPNPAIQLVSAESPIEPASPLAPRTAPMGPQTLPVPVASSGLSASAPHDWRAALQQAISGLDATAPSHPQSAGEAYQHARLRLMQLAAGDLDGAATAIPGLSSTEQSYWSNQMFAIAKLMDDQAQPETKRRAAAANLHLTDAAAQLDQLSSLAVRSLTFCNEVYGYGAYEPVESARFRAGAQLTLYAEVQHYKSVTTDDGRHTSLASSYRIVDVDGNQVDTGDFPAVEDYCLTRRRDFHIQYTVPLPERIAPGDYRLELTIEDQLGHKRGHASTDFRITTSGR